MESIYNLNKQLEQLLNLDADEQAIKDTLESMDGENDQKCINVLTYVKHIDSQLAEIKAETDRLSKIKKVLDSRAKTLKEHVINNMELRDCKKIESATLPVSYVKPKPMLVINDEKLIGDDYKVEKVVVSIDKKQMLADLKDGQEVSGASIGQSKAGIKF